MSRKLRILKIVKEEGGLDYAKQVMHDYYLQAMDILNTFEDNESKESLNRLLAYIIKRKKWYLKKL